MGICMSYSSTWNYVRRLAVEAGHTETIQNGRWLWIYDNLNWHMRVRHEREGTIMIKIHSLIGTHYYWYTDKHASMLNVTARLAAWKEDLPDWEFDWGDCKPQKSRSSLICDDFYQVLMTVFNSRTELFSLPWRYWSLSFLLLAISKGSFLAALHHTSVTVLKVR